MVTSVFTFEHPHNVHTDALPGLLGGKGTTLAALTAKGVRVPPGFTLLTSTFVEWTAVTKSRASWRTSSCPSNSRRARPSSTSSTAA